MTSNVRRSIEFFLVSQYYEWKSFLVYRAQAVLWFLNSSLSLVFTFVTISVIYTISSGIAGWSYYQLLLLASLTNIVMGLMWYIVNVGQLTSDMRWGRTDPLMSKPYGTFTLFLSWYGWPASIAESISSLVLLVYAASNLGVPTLQLALYVPLVVLGSFALISFLMMLSVLSYHLFKGGSFMWQFLNLMQTMGQYPLSIYGIGVQLVFSLVVPLGLASYYPSNVLLGRSSAEYYLAFIAVALAVSYVSYKLFYRLMRYYTSGGG